MAIGGAHPFPAVGAITTSNDYNAWEGHRSVTKHGTDSRDEISCPRTGFSLTLVHAFIAIRLDYRNSALFGCKTSVIRRLQSIQNSSARLILNIPKFGRIVTAMRDTLHWLPVRQRITFKICMLVLNCVNGSALIYTVLFTRHLQFS